MCLSSKVPRRLLFSQQSKKMASEAINNPPKDGIDDDDSDVEMEGMDLESDDEVADTDPVDGVDAPTDDNDNTSNAREEVNEKLATEDQDELEAAHKERMELMTAERKKVAEAAPNDDGTASVGEKLQFLLAQSEVFAHFLAGTVAAAGKKRGGGKKGGSRGKNRMTEAEEDAQLLKTAESKRSVIRLDKQVRKYKHTSFIKCCV
ncbi:MAG: hypothetical protein ACI8RD_014232 [Bacillariaceae sp.]